MGHHIQLIIYNHNLLSNIRQRSDVRSFAGRTEKCYHELVGALTLGLAPDPAAASHKTGALVDGAKPAIRSFLRARDVASLEQAILLSRSRT